MKQYYYQWDVHRDDIALGRSGNNGYPYHFHSHVEITYLLSGKYSAVVDEVHYDLEAGDLMVVFPYQIHEYISTDGTNREMVITATPEVFTEYQVVIQNKLPHRPIIRASEITEECRMLLHWLYNTHSNDKDVLPLRKSLINTVFWYFIHRVELLETQSSPLQIFQRIVKYCNDHYLEESLSLDSISLALGISKFHISRIISQKLKINFSTYVNTLRINHACNLLNTTDESITYIALECGYGTIRNFNRIFLKYMGQTPSEFKATRTEKKSKLKPFGDR